MSRLKLFENILKIVAAVISVDMSIVRFIGNIARRGNIPYSQAEYETEDARTSNAYAKGNGRDDQYKCGKRRNASVCIDHKMLLRKS